MQRLSPPPATEAIERLRHGDITPIELICAAASRIAALEPRGNELSTLRLYRAREHAYREA